MLHDFWIKIKTIVVQWPERPSWTLTLSNGCRNVNDAAVPAFALLHAGRTVDSFEPARSTSRPVINTSEKDDKYRKDGDGFRWGWIHANLSLPGSIFRLGCTSGHQRWASGYSGKNLFLSLLNIDSYLIERLWYPRSIHHFNDILFVSLLPSSIFIYISLKESQFGKLVKKWNGEKDFLGKNKKRSDVCR